MALKGKMGHKGQLAPSCRVLGTIKTSYHGSRRLSTHLCSKTRGGGGGTQTFARTPSVRAKNVKVFEWTILLSSATNMVTQIIYLGRMEVGDCYYSFFLVNIF